MDRLLVHPQQEPLIGIVSVPGDKSISHRAIIFAGLADGQSTIRNWLPAGDTQATMGAVKELGVNVNILERSDNSWNISVQGRGLHGLAPPGGTIDCKDAGTCMRLLAGIASGQRFAITLDGSEQLRRRPMGRVVDPLSQMGSRISTRDGKAPLRFEPAPLNGIRYELPVASAQVKSAVLLAALYAQGRTEVVEPAATRDHTERMLQAMGIRLEIEGLVKVLHGPQQRLLPLDVEIPGDISSAAFVLAAATLVAGSQVAITGVGSNPTRTGFLDILKVMGAHIGIREKPAGSNEQRSDIDIHSARLSGLDVRGELTVRAIDELPLMAVLATQAHGISTLADASELRVKEVDRIAVLARELGKMGANLVERIDGFSIGGPVFLKGGEVDSHGDHRLAMALAIAGLMASGPTIIQNARCIHDSFPGFVETLNLLGTNLEWQQD